MFDAEIENRAATLVAQARAADRRLATAESCTGGLVAAAICGVAGASDVFERGVVAYSDSAKIQLLGVSPNLIGQYGAVSKQVALAMAVGAGGGLALSITGIAGPGGGSEEKPVGCVWFGLVNRGHLQSEQRQFGDLGRHAVQRAALIRGLDLLLDAIIAR